MLQADDSLDDLKKFLQVTMGLWDYKCANIRPSQQSSTHMHATINTFQEKVNRCAERYHAARHVLFVLDPDGSWAVRLQDFKPTDVQPPIHDMDKVPKQKVVCTRTDKGAGEGQRVLSWI